MPERPLRIFVLGSFRDFGRRTGTSSELLRRHVAGLRELGWDAFMSGDRRSREIAGTGLGAWPMTERLEPLCDLAVFVVTRRGREGGWASELAALQSRHPERAGRRLVMLPQGHGLSRVLDPAHEGLLADPPVLISEWTDEQDLLAQVSTYAAFLGQWDRLPAPWEYRP